MNEQAQQALAELLQKAINGVDSIITFSQAQLPEVIQQLLIWNIVSSLLTQVGCITCLIVFYVIAKKGTKHINDNQHRYEDPSMLVFLGLLGAGMGALVMLGILMDNFIWIKIWLAPKLYLLEYASHLLK